MQKYYRIYDRTLWVVDRYHEVEMKVGIYYGAVTLKNIDALYYGGEKISWTVVDTVWGEKIKNGMLIKVSAHQARVLARRNHRRGCKVGRNHKC